MMFEEPAATREIAVVGANKPARSLALAHLLSDCIARHGWSERITVSTIGVASGAGPAQTDDVAALARSGVEVAATFCPDLAEDPTLIDEADYVVVCSDEEANVVIQCPESEGKQVYALTDFLGPEPTPLDDPDSDLASFVTQAAEAVPHLVRAVLSMRS